MRESYDYKGEEPSSLAGRRGGAGKGGRGGRSGDGKARSSGNGIGGHTAVVGEGYRGRGRGGEDFVNRVHRRGLERDHILAPHKLRRAAASFLAVATVAGGQHHLHHVRSSTRLVAFPWHRRRSAGE